MSSKSHDHPGSADDELEREFFRPATAPPAVEESATMNEADARELKPGLYRVHWVSGGSSLAAIGVLPNGDKWLAPTNWVRPSEEPVWCTIRLVERIETDGAPPPATKERIAKCIARAFGIDLESGEPDGRIVACHEAARAIAAVPVPAPPAADDAAVERVAKALATRDYDADYMDLPWDKLSELAREDYRDNARVAIAALGDPAAHVREVLREVLAIRLADPCQSSQSSIAEFLPADLRKRAEEAAR